MAVPMVSPAGSRITGLVFLLAGIGLLITAVFFGLKGYDFVQEASRADARIVALNAGGSHPQVEFETAAGETVSYPQGGLIFGYAVGDPVSVLYRPGNPSATASIDAWGALWVGEFFLFFLGLAFAIGGAGSWRATTRLTVNN